MKRIFGFEEAPVGGKRGAADHRAGAQFEPANQLFGDKRVGRPAFAAARQIKELAVATALEVDVEHAFDANRVFNRKGRGSGGSCRRCGGDGTGFGGRGSRTRCNGCDDGGGVRRGRQGFLFHTD
jgi:hypothetical protein